MCGRFALTTNEADLVEEFSITGISSSRDPLPANWNVKPTEEIYIIRNTQNVERELAQVSWGLIAPWSKNESEAIKSQSQAINARSESIHEKPTFRRAFTQTRCLIPADGYYEWATELGRYKTKQPVFISRDDNARLAFAGIYSRWTSPEGSVRESAAIITRDAVQPLASVHHRMPVFLSTNHWDEWLAHSESDIHRLRALLNVEKPADHLRYWPVRDLVNSIRNNGPELIEKIDLGESEVLF